VENEEAQGSIISQRQYFVTRAVSVLVMSLLYVAYAFVLLLPES
jgi:hypothetical protein